MGNLVGASNQLHCSPGMSPGKDPADGNEGGAFTIDTGKEMRAIIG